MENTNKKRLLFICSKRPFPVQDGGAIRTMQMYWMLSRHFDIDLVYSCNSQEQCASEPDNSLEIKSQKGFYLPKWKSLLQTFCAIFSNRPLQCAYFFNNRMSKYIRENIHNYDYVFCNNIRTALYVFNISDCVRFIDFVDAISMNYWYASQKHRFPISLLYREESSRLVKMEIKLATLFDRAFIISDIDSNYIKQKASIKIREIDVIPNSVDLPDECITQSSTFNIVFVGSMFYEPNIIAVTTFAKYIFPKIQEKIPAVKFYIVGNRPAEKVRSLANKDIIVTGFVEDPKEYLRLSNIVIAPMYSGAGVQNKILEAMSMGCCVVTTTIGSEGLGEVRNGKEICIEDDYDKMANRIITLLNDRYSRERMGKMAKDYISNNFSFDKVYSIFIDKFIDEGIK